MAHNAKAGGEIGANGEFYKGGQFVADSDHPKGCAAPHGRHKIMTAPYYWIVADWNTVALYEKLEPRLLCTTTMDGGRIVRGNWRLNDDFGESGFYRELLDRWLNGQQTMTVQEFCDLAKWHGERNAWVKVAPGNRNVHRAIDLAQG